MLPYLKPGPSGTQGSVKHMAETKTAPEPANDDEAVIAQEHCLVCGAPSLAVLCEPCRHQHERARPQVERYLRKQAAANRIVRSL